MKREIGGKVGVRSMPCQGNRESRQVRAVAGG